MSSANSLSERNILRAMSQGIQSWINDRMEATHVDLSQVRIGRWSNFDTVPEHAVEFEYQESYRPCDLAVMFGSWKPREKGSHNTRNSVAQNASKFLVIETPLLNRRTDEENTYWRIGLNGYLNRDAEWPILPKDQATARLNALGIKWINWQHNPQGHIVLALQLPGDASLRGADINEWALQSVITMRKNTNREIRIRSHPLCSARGFNEHGELAARLNYMGIENLRFSDGAMTSWREDIKDAWCTVTYSSGMAVDSVLAGIPTIACDEGNFAWGISTNDPAQVEQLQLADKPQVRAWLNFLAGCQWSIEEMRDGSAWHHLYRLITKS